MVLVDSYNRKINYLQISIVDRCNLNCSYCMPVFSGRKFLACSGIVTCDEMLTFAESAVAIGISIAVAKNMFRLN